MARRFEQDEEQELEPRRSRKRRREAPSEPQAVPEKQSYESSVDVQRWLSEQRNQAAEIKPPFEPSLLAGRRDRDWVLSSLTLFYEQDLIDDVLLQASSGKEATVYCCSAGPASDCELLAAKIYRPRMFRSLSNDAVYRQGRRMHDIDGRPVRNPRRALGSGGSTRGRGAQVNHWISYEFETQAALFGAGADVPRPISQAGNAVLMEYIGDAGGPAPRLQDVTLDRRTAHGLFERLIENIQIWLRCQRIHGDLSAFNILYQPERLVIIDFAQAIDPRHSEAAYSLLLRDVERVCGFFARYGVRADAQAISAELWSRYLFGGV